MRLLIVEDEKRLADTLRQLLHRQGYTADVSYDGVSGLDNAMSGIYDLVILDVMLPGMNGFQVAQKLRQAGERYPYMGRPVVGARHLYSGVRWAGCAPQPPGIRPDGAADAQRYAGGHQGADAGQGVGI